MRRKHHLVALLVMLAFIMGGIMPVYADNIKDQQQKLQDVDQQIKQQKNNLNNTKKKEKSILDELANLEKGISKTEQEIKSTSERISFLENSIDNTEKEINEIEKNLAKQSGILGERLVFMYEEGDTSFLEVLLSASDIKDFLTRYDLISSIFEQDVKLIDSISSQKKELTRKKNSLQARKNEIQSMQQEQMTMKATLASRKSEKNVILGKVQQEKQQYLRSLQDLERTSRMIEDMIRRMQASSSGTQIGTGTYTRPAPGAITSSYGMRYHPVLKQYKMHTGVDIGASSGTSIVAADAGKVIYSGWMGGYGQVVIIDHGGGMSTLYAHQSRILVSNGASVSKGQVIGKVGSTGWSTGPHLHFEVRKNGSHINPMGYI